MGANIIQFSRGRSVSQQQIRQLIKIRNVRRKLEEREARLIGGMLDDLLTDVPVEVGVHDVELVWESAPGARIARLRLNGEAVRSGSASLEGFRT